MVFYYKYNFLKFTTLFQFNSGKYTVVPNLTYSGHNSAQVVYVQNPTKKQDGCPKWRFDGSAVVNTSAR